MKALYLEPDEEITSVIDRLKAVDDADVAIVVPKRAGILQSIINLKLLRYQAEQFKKKISIVTTDKTGRNLASAVGLTVHQRLPEGEKISEAVVRETTGTPVPINFKKRRTVTPAAQAAAAEAAAKPVRMRKQQVAAPTSEPTQTVAPVVADAVSEAAAPRTAQKKPRDRPAASGLSLTALRGRIKLPKLPRPKFNVPRPKRFGWKGLAAAALALLLASGAYAATALPQATVTVTPKSEQLNLDVPLTFSARATSADAQANVVPAKVIEVTKEASAALDATGTKEAGERARGQITVINTLSRNQSLVARTRFQAPDGRIFRSQISITVPAGGQTPVEVVADEGGEAGNLAAGTRLSIPGLGGSQAVYGQVDTPLAGGTSTPSKEVSSADLDRGRAALATEAVKAGLEEARGKLAVGFTLSEQAVATTVLNSSVTPPVGSSAETFTTTGRIRIRYFTYEADPLKKILLEDVRPKIPAGAELAEEQFQLTYVVTGVSADNLVGVMKVGTASVSQLSRDRIREAISGQTADGARQALEGLGLTDVVVDLSPFWVNRVPDDPGKIEVHYAGAASSPSPSPSPSVAPAPGPAGEVSPSLPPSI